MDTNTVNTPETYHKPRKAISSQFAIGAVFVLAGQCIDAAAAA
jgi:hypothetical protein